MSRTEEFLKAAFAGKPQTNRRYLAFALKAEEEGHLQTARLFRAAARRKRSMPATTLRPSRESIAPGRTGRRPSPWK